VASLEAQLAAAKAEVEEAQRDAAAFAQDLADHLSRQQSGGGGGGGGSGPSAADKAALRQAQAETAAARKEVEWLSSQLSAAQGGGDGNASDQACVCTVNHSFPKHHLCLSISRCLAFPLPAFLLDICADLMEDSSLQHLNTLMEVYS